jgi:ribosomal protein S18 acetylase RimI-like enzyme
MFELFIYEEDRIHVPTPLKVNFLTFDLKNTLNKFLYFSSQYLLVHKDSYFKNYIPIVLVTHNEDGAIYGMCELLWNKETNTIEIYNVCVLPDQRSKGHCKNLINYILEHIQPILNCDLWIAVSYINPMYDIVVNIYKNLGFTDLIQTNITTPSGIEYNRGFMELFKFKK